MSLPATIHVPEPRSSKPAIFGLLKSPAQLLMLSSTPTSWLKSKSVRSTLEYENPDLTQPSVSSF
jgi:hypothetical protein